METKIYAHGSYIGDTGYNQHTREFFRHLSNHAKIKVRNFTIGTTWKSYNLEPHSDEKYFNETDRKLLFEQILWNNDNTRSNFPIYPSGEKNFDHDVNIVLCETNHHLFYDDYVGPKIAYNVWESTLQPQVFFDKLKEFDELWVPSKWQKDCTVAQGYDPNKIKVVPEGVDSSVFFPDSQIKHQLTSDGRFKFFLAGRWDYRKSIKEIIETFLKTFSKNEPVDLIVSVDNPFSNDGLKTTEERLKHYNLEDFRIKVIHFPSRVDYIDILKSCSCFVSCARSEGWNLPLIEAMACGIPSIYSNCSGQLEFAEGKGIPVNIIGERPASDSSYNHFNETVGNYYEPDFDDLLSKMRFVYEFYNDVKKKSIDESEEIRKKFSWENIATIGMETLNEFLIKQKSKPKVENKISVSYIDGPRVEITGSEIKNYFIEFVDSSTGDVLHSGTIQNNMWIACGKKYYVPWQIKINGVIHEELNLKGQVVMISLESKSLGDTIAWCPYAVEFARKHRCVVLLSTFHNNLFKGVDTYKDVIFISPGTTHECHALYRLGWFRKDNKWGDIDRNPKQVNTIPLQKTATDILGLDYNELNYGVNIVDSKKLHDKKYVVFGPEATSGCKEWTYEYWTELSDMMKQKGYDVFTLTKKPYHINGTKNICNKSIDTVINYLLNADMFFGLGSGLSWLNWSLNKHTFMINGFSKDGHEFNQNVTRIYKENTCISCWNDEVFVFDSGDWDWCPVYKGTNKQHICQKSITPNMVIEKFNSWIK